MAYQNVLDQAYATRMDKSFDCSRVCRRNKRIKLRYQDFIRWVYKAIEFHGIVHCFWFCA